MPWITNEIMPWIKALETGIQSVDKQHADIFRFAEQLLAVENQERLPEIMDALQDRMLAHFVDEQRLHILYNYPEAALHKLYHDRFYSSFTALRLRFLEKDAGLTGLAAYKYTIDWLKNHIVVHDMRFIAYHRDAWETNSQKNLKSTPSLA